MGNPVKKVLELLPLSCSPSKWIYLFRIPVSAPLGEDEKDYSAVQVSVFSQDGILATENRTLEYFSTGRLGCLTGGLLNLDDRRKVMSKKDVAHLAEATTEARLATKRTDQQR